MLTFASQASVGLQNALLVEQAGRRLDDLQVLGALSEKLASGTAGSELFADALRLVGDAARADAGVFRLFAPSQGTHAYRRAEELNPEEVDGMENLLGDLASQMETAQNLTLLSTSHAAPTLVVPIPAGAGEAPRGVMIFVRAPQQPGFDGHEQELAATAANILSACLHNFVD